MMATVSVIMYFVYNEQPGVAIDHATGESHLAEDAEV